MGPLNPDFVARNTGPASADGGDTGGDTIPTNKPKVTSLGNGYSLIEWTDEIGMSHSQIVPDKDAATIAAQAAASATGINAEVTRARDAATAAHNAAVLALEQGNAAAAREQFAVSSKELARAHDIEQQNYLAQQQLASHKFGFDVYNKLAKLASNPRNYMEQFFRLRGQPAPTGSAQYGNTPVTGPGLATFEQFLPQFLKATGLGGAYAANAVTGSAGTAAANPRAGGAFMPGLFGSAANPNPMPTPVQAGPAITELQAGATTPNIPSQYISPTGQGALGQQFQGVQGTPIAFNAHGGADIIGAPGGLDQPRQLPKQYAKGGEMTMTAPHAIVNLLSGKVSAIAGEQPGRGPQGFVPEQAKFSGQAVIDPTFKEDSLPPSQPTPSDIPVISGDTTIQVPFTPMPLLPPSGLQPLTPLPHATDVLAPPMPPTLPKPPPPEGPDTVAAPAAPPTTVAAPPPLPPPNPVPNFSPNFLQQLLGLSSTPSGLGKNPAFLPEDEAAKDAIVGSLIQAGSFPPFLQRLYGQQRGLPGLGTNVPQQTNLPNGLPLASRLALSQMNPSELAAFQSFISAHGLDWNDYLAMVDAASPQGGGSQTSYPKFLSQ